MSVFFTKRGGVPELVKEYTVTITGDGSSYATVTINGTSYASAAEVDVEGGPR